MTTPELAVHAFLMARGVSRLTHFTASRNLFHIFRDRSLRSSSEMKDDPSATFAPTDPERLDGHPDKISCSVQYPNVFYLNRAKARPEARNYPDWACLLLAPEIAARPGTLFSYRNASAGYGAHVRPGLAGLSACYEQQVQGAFNRTYARGPRHQPCCPTDVQAEVLVPGRIPLSSVLAIAMPSDALVVQERGRLQLLGYSPDTVEWIVSPGLFETGQITDAVQRGHAILERPFDPDSTRTGL